MKKKRRDRNPEPEDRSDQSIFDPTCQYVNGCLARHLHLRERSIDPHYST